MTSDATAVSKREDRERIGQLSCLPSSSPIPPVMELARPGAAPSNSPLNQLHDTLGIHEKHFPVSFPLQGGCVAVQDAGDLGGKGEQHSEKGALLCFAKAKDHHTTRCKWDLRALSRARQFSQTAASPSAANVSPPMAWRHLSPSL